MTLPTTRIKALLCCAVALAACKSSPASTPAGADAAQLLPDAAGYPDASLAAPDASTGDADASVRTMVERPLFGDTHPQNLLIDPIFSVRSGGLGNWMAATADQSQAQATLSASLLSDSPAGIAMATARLADARASTGHFQLDLLAQVPGGPGPYHLRVWLSTLDPTASASLTGVTVGLLRSLGEYSAIEVSEDPAKVETIAGRTWHLFTGQITSPLTVGGFVLLDFTASANTWLVQAPEFIPVALDPTPTQEILTRRLASAPRPLSAHERALVDRYRHQPKISVPAGHPAVIERQRDALRR